jgi:UDP-N-acetylglucosamine 1-carboxyvinyltransferase
MGVRLSAEERRVRVWGNPVPRPVEVTTLPYPGFPTDLQAQLLAYVSVADGVSLVTERIYPDRFMHVAELGRLGADIRKEGPTAIVRGVPRLAGAPVRASDLRGSACLVIAGLAASGRTEVHDVHHLDRGYERIEQRLAQLGACIRRESAEPAVRDAAPALAAAMA